MSNILELKLIIDFSLTKLRNFIRESIKVTINNES